MQEPPKQEQSEGESQPELAQSESSDTQEQDSDVGSCDTFSPTKGIKPVNQEDQNASDEQSFMHP